MTVESVSTMKKIAEAPAKRFMRRMRAVREA
jgi:hypothetical protein